MSRLLALALLVSASAMASPTTLVHQGRLLDSTGTPVSGSKTLTFVIEDGSGGEVWSQDLPVVLEDGYYSVVLGNLGDLDTTDFPPGETRVLVVKDGTTALGGPLALHPVPYAVSATNASGGVVAPAQLQLPTADTRACDATTLGAMRFNTLLGEPEFCGAAGWTGIGAGSRSDLNVTAPTTFTGGVFTSGRAVADGIAYRVTPPADGANAVSRYDAADDLSVGFASGDLALLINMQGVPGDSDDVGSHEVVTVAQVTPSTITFTGPLTASYDGTTPAQQKVVLQRIPTYNNVAITDGGSLGVSPWDGLSSKPYRTGILAMRVTGTLSIAPSGALTVDGAGFRGGSGSASGYCQWGYNGEGMDQPARTLEGAANTGGGRGGGREGSWCIDSSEHRAMPGGGASYGTSGTGGTGSTAGAVYGDAALGRIFLGSGGGGASAYRHSSGLGRGGAGGAGGGMLYVIANAVDNDGTISANGANGANHVTHGGGGGGGSGGSIHLITGTYTGASPVAAGGAGGTGYSSAVGGNGGDGRVLVE